jgi:hypothetical protein
MADHGAKKDRENFKDSLLYLVWWPTLLVRAPGPASPGPDHHQRQVAFQNRKMRQLPLDDVGPAKQVRWQPASASDSRSRVTRSAQARPGPPGPLRTRCASESAPASPAPSRPTRNLPRRDEQGRPERESSVLCRAEPVAAGLGPPQPARSGTQAARPGSQYYY